MRSLVVSALPLLLVAAPAGAQEDDSAARTLVQRAVQAHGGAGALARVRADRVAFKGTLTVRGHAVPFTARTTMQLPSHYRHEIETNDGGDKHRIVYVINADKVSIAIDGQAIRADAAQLAEIRNGMELQRAQRLLPLLEDRSYQLAVLEELKVNDRPAAGVRVTGRGRKEMRLYFDKEFGLLVRADMLLDDGRGKTVRQNYFYGDFKDVGGYKRYTKVRALRDGHQVMEAELTDAKLLDRVDESEFDRP